MPDEILVEHCSPTLAGLKTGNLFSCRFADRASMLADVRKLNRVLVPKGLRLIPFRFRNGKALLYLYRPSALIKDLRAQEAEEILAQSGYEATGESLGQRLGMLIQRISGNEEFPHEIGLFLSYPPEDVRGFIEECARTANTHAGASECCSNCEKDNARSREMADCTCKCVGAWKVYGDAQKAQACFRRYECCKQIYTRCLKNGMSISDLAVSVRREAV